MKFSNLFSLRKWVEFLLASKVGRKLPDKWFVQLEYFYAVGKCLNLKNPITYNEKLQWLKLYDRNPLYTQMVDKIAAKKYVVQHIGQQHVVPILGIWDNPEDIDFDILPDQFVLKVTHDSGGLIVCKDKTKLNRERTVKKLKESMQRDYYMAHREWPYKDVTRRIFAETYISQDQCVSKSLEPEQNSETITTSELQYEQGLLDYKFMCFDGRVEVLFLDIGVVGSGEGHAEEYYRNVYDRAFNLLPVKETRENYPKKIQKPETFERMIEIAELLSKGIPHLRVDLYSINGNIYVGEMTFYHGSGLGNVFDPPEWDKKLGDLLVLPKR